MKTRILLCVAVTLAASAQHKKTYGTPATGWSDNSHTITLTMPPSCPARYSDVIDELDQAMQALSNAADALYDPVSRLHRMVIVRSRNFFTNCTEQDQRDLDAIEKVLLEKGLAVTPQQRRDKQDADERAGYAAALQQFQDDLKTLKSAK